MKISLIIPAYNEEAYLGACLEHAIKNSDDILSEIIVVDNRSTDATRAIAEKFPGVRVVREEQKGITHARERGFHESHGDVLAYIDADTRMPEGWAQKIETSFTDPKIGSLSGPYVYYDISPLNAFLVRLYWRILGMPSYFLVGYMMTGGNFAIRRSVLEKMEGFDTDIAFYGEDTDTARRASKFGKMKFDLDFVMYTSGRRLHEQGVTKTFLIYVGNFLSQVLWHRPVTKKYEDIR